MHCQLSYDSEEPVKMASVSVYYNEQHALDSILPVIGVLLHVADRRTVLLNTVL